MSAINPETEREYVFEANNKKDLTKREVRKFFGKNEHETLPKLAHLKEGLSYLYDKRGGNAKQLNNELGRNKVRIIQRDNEGNIITQEEFNGEPGTQKFKQSFIEKRQEESHVYGLHQGVIADGIGLMQQNFNIKEENNVVHEGNELMPFSAAQVSHLEKDGELYSYEVTVPIYSKQEYEKLIKKIEEQSEVERIRLLGINTNFHKLKEEVSGILKNQYKIRHRAILEERYTPLELQNPQIQEEIDNEVNSLIQNDKELEEIINNIARKKFINTYKNEWEQIDTDARNAAQLMGPTLHKPMCMLRVKASVDCRNLKQGETPIATMNVSIRTDDQRLQYIGPHNIPEIRIKTTAPLKHLHTEEMSGESNMGVSVTTVQQGFLQQQTQMDVSPAKQDGNDIPVLSQFDVEKQRAVEEHNRQQVLAQQRQAQKRAPAPPKPLHPQGGDHDPTQGNRPK